MTCISCKSKSVFKTAKNIATGVINLMSDSPEIEALATERLNKCKVCPYAKELIRVEDRIVLQCLKCKCLCALKARVKEEECPLLLW